MNAFRRLLAAIAAIGLLSIGLALAPAHADAATGAPKLWLGALQATESDAVPLAEAGLTRVTLELGWDAFEPQNGQWNGSYISQMQAEYDYFRSLGLDVVLDPGLQYPASWVFDLPGNTRFEDQYGDTWQGGIGTDPANAVTDPAVRNAEQTYLQQIAADFSSRPFVAVRLGGLLDGELRYPPLADNHPDNLWMYDAQTQATMPYPGWSPGTGTVTEASADLQQYFDNLTGYESWLISLTDGLFPWSQLQVLFPGFGLRPGQVTTAVDNDLSNLTIAENAQGIAGGLDWPEQVAAVAASTKRGVVYTTWLDGGPDHGTSVQNESPIAYLSSLAKPYGLPLAGENTGGTDPEVMSKCALRAHEFQLQGFMWFSARLLDRKPGGLASFENFVAEETGTVNHLVVNSQAAASTSPPPITTPSKQTIDPLIQLVMNHWSPKPKSGRGSHAAKR